MLRPRRPPGALRAAGLLRWGAVAVVLTALSIRAASAQPPVARPCATSDLPGTWDVVRISAAFPIDEKNPYYYPHQRYVFEASGGVRHVTSTQQFSRAEFAAMIRIPATSTWSLEDRGRLMITRPGESPEPSLCTFGLGAVEDLKVGDVVLTYFDRSGKPVLKRVLRRLP